MSGVDANECSPSVEPVAPPPRSGDVALWVFTGALGVAVVFLASVHMPQRIKLPLISPVALGALTGWGLGRWAVVRGVPHRNFVTLVVAALIAAGCLGAAVVTYRQSVRLVRRAAQQKLADQSLAAQLDQHLSAASEVSTDESAVPEATEAETTARQAQALRRRAAESARLERLATFRGYLENRIPLAWGRWPSPLPELFWLMEVLLASAIGAWVARRTVSATVTR